MSNLSSNEITHTEQLEALKREFHGAVAAGEFSAADPGLQIYSGTVTVDSNVVYVRFKGQFDVGSRGLGVKGSGYGLGGITGGAFAGLLKVYVSLEELKRGDCQFGLTYAALGGGSLSIAFIRNFKPLALFYAVGVGFDAGAYGGSARFGSA